MRWWGGPASTTGSVEPIDASGLFGPVEHATFSHVQEVDRETLRELVLSRSYCAVLSEEERAPVLQNVDDLFTEHARDGVAEAAVPDRVLPRDPAVSAAGRTGRVPSRRRGRRPAALLRVAVRRGELPDGGGAYP